MKVWAVRRVLLVLALFLFGATGSNLRAAPHPDRDGVAPWIYDYDQASTPTTGASTTHSGAFRGYDGRSHTSQLRLHAPLRVLAAEAGATVGRAASADYRATFLAAHPELEGQVIVHHAVEQQVLTKYPGLFDAAEIHSLENLRGIPIAENSATHLSAIRKS